MNKTKKQLVTMALTYANGQLHLGHLLEAIQTDIWVRQQRMQGHDTRFFAGSDAHGTPIMLAAEKAELSPEAFIQQIQDDHERDYQDFLIDFDHFHTTHSPENKTLTEEIYRRLKANNDISTKVISQAFDPEKECFLADRFVKGECPRCSAPDQYGDNCEICGATYSPTDLKSPYSVLSGATPIQKESEHYFFHLEHYTDFLKQWIEVTPLSSPIKNKLVEWFDAGLMPWDISRDAPYFGFEIPDAPHKYFYVWLDAPVGYIASFEHWRASQQPDLSFDDYWGAKSDAELYHFIGKDIMYFHALFWPAMLKGAKLRLPNNIFVHGYLTVDGKKMSKSRGTFITAKTYIEQLPAEYLRYYFAAKLSPTVEDIDLNLPDFMQRINSDLVGKYVNLASRTAGFVTKKFDGRLATTLQDPELYQVFVDAGEKIQAHYNALQFSHAVREIMQLADRANQYVDHHKPWALIKTAGNEETVHQVCTQSLNLFRVLTAYLKPILPETAQKVETFLACDALDWDTVREPLLNHPIEKFKPLMQRIQEEQISALTIT